MIRLLQHCHVGVSSDPAESWSVPLWRVSAPGRAQRHEMQRTPLGWDEIVER
jgi:hypothetical protein